MQNTKTKQELLAEAANMEAMACTYEREVKEGFERGTWFAYKEIRAGELRGEAQELRAAAEQVGE